MSPVSCEGKSRLTCLSVQPTNFALRNQSQDRQDTWTLGVPESVLVLADEVIE